MKTLPKIASVLFFLCSVTLVLHAQVPQVINYQGRVIVGTTTFNGTGQFKFALVDPGGSTSFWSNDGTSTGGSEPGTAVALTVTNGLYSVLLGDTTIPNMTVAIPFSAFNNSDVRLRVWFNDGTHGSQLLSPDQRIAAVGYSMTAVTAVTMPASGVTGTLGVTHGGTGSTTAGGALTNLGAAATSGNLSQFTSTTSAQLAGVVTDETGTGPLVFGSSPTISSPTISSPTISSGTISSPTISTPTITGTTTLEGNNLNVGGDANFILARPTNTTGAGALFLIRGQDATGTNQNGGALLLNAGVGTGTGQNGNISIGSSNTSAVNITPTTAFLGAIHLSTGTAAAPSLTFTNDSNTGMFRSAADTLDFATGGVSRMSISPTGVISGDGSGLTLGQSALTVFGTSTQAIPNTGGFTLLPGLTQTLTLPANGVVYIETDGGVQTTSVSTTGFSATDIQIFIDNVASGVQRRVITANTGGFTSMSNSWSMSVTSSSLAAGNHTIDVRAAGAGLAGGLTATVSGSGSSIHQGRLNIVVIR
jgi:hypothetical protein